MHIYIARACLHIPRGRISARVHMCAWSIQQKFQGKEFVESIYTEETNPLVWLVRISILFIKKIQINVKNLEILF